ncbi:hypothetical protein HHK36_030550 [Tetracentron sinense]|uniref:Uncharacterized protein n=1 Tax=Tetracentron sinense TaxID=13715 RepID=A0A834YBW2_TETSI|nr:hypothetical protein HHK36_030550 [Tetracentron sinense]
MGGCATKPKVLKAEDNTVPEPAPATAKDESCTDSDAKIAGGTEEIGAVKVEGGGDGEKEKVDDDKSKEGKESTGNDKTTQTEDIPSEPIKQEEPKTQNAIKESNTSIPETEKAENPVVGTLAPVVAVASKTVETEKPTEAATTVETKKPENSEEKKTEEKVSVTEDVKVTQEASKIDGRQDGPVLPVSSAEKVAGEVAETK